jgi:3',5'-cyclic AMP phosphodiesterase CpdA
VQSDPKELAFMLARLAVRFRKLVPDVVVISGDVSSCASDDEFKAFRVFCEELSMALWEEPCPWKILVVPGNHDVTWMSNGAADQMAGFRRHFSADDVCLTPFGTAEREFADGNVVVRRVNSRPSSVPPFAVVTYRNYGLDILLLVSGYFSGEIIPDIRNKLSCIGVTGSDSDFIDLLRLDRGSVDHEYLFWIDKCFTERKNLALGVIHHNPVQYGIQTCENPMAPELMETLWRKGIRVLLHGHVHLSEANSSQRPPVPFRAYPMPAPTLCSVTTAGSGRGINILFVGRDGSGTRIDTLVWSFTESLAFNTGDAVLRYRLALRDGELEIFSGKAR